jgi:hypothetical protein
MIGYVQCIRLMLQHILICLQTLVGNYRQSLLHGEIKNVYLISVFSVFEHKILSNVIYRRGHFIQGVEWPAARGPLVLGPPPQECRYHALRIYQTTSEYLKNVFTDLLVYAVVSFQ